jgi:hypothetical protein
MTPTNRSGVIARGFVKPVQPPLAIRWLSTSTAFGGGYGSA